MGSSDKGASGTKTYDIFGTIAGGICQGPIDALLGIVVDGKSVWEGTKAASGDYSDLKGDIVTASGSKWFANSNSYFRVYWGTETQSADGALGANAPGFRGIAYFVAQGFLFGRQRYTAPNMEFIWQRKPRIDASLEGGVNVLQDGQTNPILAAAELLTNQRFGLGQPVGRLNVASWVAAAQWADVSGRRLRTLCSPLVTSAVSLRQTLRELLSMADCALAWDADGKLAVRIIEPGVNPGGLLSIDAAIQTAPAVIESGGWDQVPTSVVARYVDRSRQWKESDEMITLSGLYRIHGDVSTKREDLPHVTRREQAALWASELARRQASPVVRGSVTCRRQRVANLRPGDKVIVDVDPEPGGAGLGQLCVVEDVRHPAFGGPSKIGFVADSLAAAAVYSPSYETPTLDDVPVPPVATALAVALPPGPWGGVFGFGVLAVRPSADIVGMRVFFAENNAGSFAELGTQEGFAVRLNLDTAIDTDDTVLRFSLIDGADGPDAYLAGRTPTGGEIQAVTDELLVLLVSLDVNGRVTVTDGIPDMEFASVISRSAVDADTHDYTVLRARRGTIERSWASNSKAWLIPLRSLVAWSHPSIEGLATSGALGYVRLTALTPFAVDETDPAPEFAFRVASKLNGAPTIEWITPSGSGAQTDSAGRFTPAFKVTDGQGDLTYVGLYSEDVNGSIIRWVDGPMPPRSEWIYSAGELIIPDVGMHSFTVVARDRLGSESTATRTIQRPGTSGGGALLQPTFSPVPGTTFLSQLDVTISVTSPANRIEWMYEPPGTPSVTHSGTVSLTTPRTITILRSGRFWVRVGDGTNWGGWVSADYTRA